MGKWLSLQSITHTSYGIATVVREAESKELANIASYIYMDL